MGALFSGSLHLNWPGCRPNFRLWADITIINLLNALDIKPFLSFSGDFITPKRRVLEWIFICTNSMILSLWWGWCAPRNLILTRPSTLGGGKHELTSWQVNMWIHCPRYRRWYDPNAGSTQEWQVYTFCGYDVTGQGQIAIEIEKHFLCSMLKTAQQGVTSTFIPSKQRRP